VIGGITIGEGKKKVFPGLGGLELRERAQKTGHQEGPKLQAMEVSALSLTVGDKGLGGGGREKKFKKGKSLEKGKKKKVPK